MPHMSSTMLRISNDMLYYQSEVTSQRRANVPKTYKNLFLLTPAFDTLVCQAAPSVTAFARAAKINNSTMVYARQRGHVRLATAERIASHYARYKHISVDIAMQLLFEPWTPLKQDTKPKQARAPRSAIQRFGNIMVRVTHKHADPHKPEQTG